mmetsp:Transcript_24744/g.50119  ORF Transcript_24744/g.50119 Transcript_24744/m.50119 type:complete len:258 (+) Transcript_24744:102-875(+)
MAALKALPAACLAEFCAMALFVIFGCGSAMGIASARSASDASLSPSWVLLVSLVFGLAIAVLAYSIAHISGAHINCAVTFGLVLGGHAKLVEGVAYFVSQMLGSVVGALILMLVYPTDMDQTQGLGSNGISEGWNWYNAFVGEIIGTCLLVTVVLQTACNPDSAANRAQAALAIGLSVFLAHSILIPIDGCSINPTRSFGPALVAHFRYADGEKSPFKDMWIFWVGPLVGSAVAVFMYEALRLLTPHKESPTEKAEV